MSNEALQDEVLRVADESVKKDERSRASREFVWYRDINYKPVSNYVIRGLLAQESLALIYGEPGTGKSFFAIDLALCVASGHPWRNHKVRQGVVIYLAAEAGASIARRVVAWRRYHEIDDADFAIRTLPLDLLEEARVADLIELLEEIARVAGRICLIVVDTVSRSMPGGDENAAETMTRYVGHCDQLRARTGATALLVHHRGKDAARGARGHSSLKAAIDTEIEVTKGLAKVTKQRDELSGIDFPFALLQVEIGIDDEGAAQTSCIVVPEADAPATATSIKLTQRQQGVFESIKLYIDEAGQDVVEGPLTGKRIVSLQAAVDRVAAVIQLPKPYRRRAEARRVIDALAQRRCLAKTDADLWIE